MEIIEAAADVKKRRRGEDEDDDSIPAAEILSEEEGKKKTAHIILLDFNKTDMDLNQPDFRVRWITFNPHEESSSFIEKTDRLKAALPDHFDRLVVFTVVALQQKLYFLGGYHDPEGAYSKKVFAFNTLSESWEIVADMRHHRGNFVVVPCGGRIYVFGFHFPSYNDSTETYHPLPPSQWAEFYDPTQDKWHYIAGETPLQLTQAMPLPARYSVLEEQKVVLLWVNPGLAHGYSINDNRWFCASLPPPRRFFSDYFRAHVDIPSIATVKSNIVWFSRGDMYTYDLEPDGSGTSPADAIPPSLASAAITPRHTTPTPTLPPHLGYCLWGDCVDAGNGKLCFIGCIPHKITVLKLDLRYSPSRKAFIPHYQGCNTHDNCDFALYSFLAM